MTELAAGSTAELWAWAPDGVAEVREGDDLARLVVDRLGDRLRDGDVLVVTSKVVSKAEGRSSTGDRAQLVVAETDRVVARRGRTAIVRTRHGLVMAAAGVDASNTAPGTVLPLPVDPDASARRLRERVGELADRNVAVVVSDTAGRAWRTGQTDLAVGAAGLRVLLDYAGTTDPHGNPLVVTAPAVADEVASAGDLVKGKVAGRPVAVVRGLAHLVLPPGEHGPGAAALVRAEDEDMFGLGAREAVLVALGDGAATDLRGFGAPAAPDELAQVLSRLAGEPDRARVEEGEVVVPLPPLGPRALGRWQTRLETAAVALGWSAAHLGEPDDRLRFRSSHP